MPLSFLVNCLFQTKQKNVLVRHNVSSWEHDTIFNNDGLFIDCFFTSLFCLYNFLNSTVRNKIHLVNANGSQPIIMRDGTIEIELVPLSFIFYNRAMGAIAVSAPQPGLRLDQDSRPAAHCPTDLQRMVQGSLMSERDNMLFPYPRGAVGRCPPAGP